MARRSLSKDTTTVRQRLDGHAIVLVGLMGAGKSSIGRRLAEKLEIPFVDADHEIEIAADKTIPDKDKKELIKEFEKLLKAAQPIQYPSNIELVRKYYDKIDTAMQ